MPDLTCMRGLPGSGKSSLALATMEYFPGKYFRSNRDSIRLENFGKTGVLDHPIEELITTIQRQQVKAALDAGFNIIIDDTHLRNKYLADWDRFARQHGAAFFVHTVETPVDVCVERDSARGRQVGEKKIRDMAQKFTRDGKFAPYVAPDTEKDSVQKVWEPAVWSDYLPHCILVDLDGTMAHIKHRSPYATGPEILKDVPNRAVVNLVNRLLKDGYYVKFFSGRKEEGRYNTLTWLRRNLKGTNWDLTMRSDDDNRKDDIVKYELYNQHVRGKFNVKFVLDDRDQVVKMWRAMGLSCFQVAEGNF